MSYKDTLTFASNTTDSGCITTSNAGLNYYTYANPIVDNGLINLASQNIINEKEGEDMRYLYEVILVNPINDAYEIFTVVAKSETSALMQAYDEHSKVLENIEFDDLKTQCRILMEWKKEKDLKKAIETIKEAVK